MNTYTLVSCHFGDFFWIENLLSHIDEFHDNRIKEIIIVDQSRNSRIQIESHKLVDRVLTFDYNYEHQKVIGHDHAASLDSALKTVKFETSHVLILDSDCFPLHQGWLDGLNDVVLAADPKSRGLSHPCFMVIPVKYLEFVNFSQGLLELGIDCGRLVALQLIQRNVPVELWYPSVAFRGLRGYFYGKDLYHHGSASFVNSHDPRLLKDLVMKNEVFFRQKVSSGNFSVSLFEYAKIKWNSILSRFIKYLNK